MKKSLQFRALVLLCLLSLLLGACKGKSGILLSYRDGAFRSKDGNTAFVAAPETYFAISALTDTVIATIDNASFDDTPLYAIENAEATSYLSDEYLMLYYAEGLTLPTLAELGVTKIALSQHSEDRVTRQLEATLTNGTYVADLVRRISEDERLPATLFPSEIYHRMDLLFVSERNTTLGILLEYRIFSSDVAGYGTQFVYDRETKTYVAVGNVLETYFLDGAEQDSE